MGTTGGDPKKVAEAAEAAGVYAVVSPQMGKQVGCYRWKSWSAIGAPGRLGCRRLHDSHRRRRQHGMLHIWHMTPCLRCMGQLPAVQELGPLAGAASAVCRDAETALWPFGRHLASSESWYALNCCRW
eukprot:GHUV01021226.1.p2 GENE.GHUV01021226.1~~GHUV01021226.1.p2  ORF type:complete len:128 (+),score=22.37 GHUV01021226.1:84-467(+)